MNLGLVTNQIFLISGFLAQGLGLGFHQRRERDLQPERNECMMVVYAEDARGYNLFYPSSQNTFIEISMQFEEELMAELELAPGKAHLLHHKMM